jgi:nitronate monooxygenase
MAKFLADFGPRPAIPDGPWLPDFAAQCAAIVEAGPTAISSIMGVFPAAVVAAAKARGIANAVARAPAPPTPPYPVQRALFAPVRAAAEAAGDPAAMQMWAGQGAHLAAAEPAAVLARAPVVGSTVPAAIGRDLRLPRASRRRGRMSGAPDVRPTNAATKFAGMLTLRTVLALSPMAAATAPTE